jgi:phospholipid-binding lipoprotein MlaA
MNKKLFAVLILVGLTSPVYSQEYIEKETQIVIADDNDNEDYNIPEQKEISDPLESINRPIYSFNKTIDHAVLKPITKTYQDITPNIIQSGVTNFINYIKQPVNVVYFSLQGNKYKAGDSMGRFLLNTFGLGVFDLASQANIPLHDTSFGETLGVWGVGEGPYVVLPILGGATLRDNTAKVVVDIPLSLENQFNIPERNLTIGLKTIETRKQLLPMDKTIEEAALDEYSFVKNAIISSKRATIKSLKEPEEEPISVNN